MHGSSGALSFFSLSRCSLLIVQRHDDANLLLLSWHDVGRLEHKTQNNSCSLLKNIAFHLILTVHNIKVSI